MSRRFVVAALVLALPIAIAGFSVPAGAERSEQVVFSGEGDGSFGEVEFWIWCQVESANPYETDCNGAMTFDDQGIHGTHVTGDASEPDDDVYQMDVASRSGNIDCTLRNVPPIVHGPRNTVHISCSTPSGSGTSTTAVVNSNG